MSDKFPIYRQADVVLTADNYQLGQAVRLYHRQTDIDPEKELFPHYLMVANLTIGDEFYVPTTYLTTQTAGKHTLNLTLAEVKKEQLTHLPRFIAMGQAREESLPQPLPEPPQPEAKEMKTFPLPPNW